MIFKHIFILLFDILITSTLEIESISIHFIQA
jgi:hypothetical protein